MYIINTILIIVRYLRELMKSYIFVKNELDLLVEINISLFCKFTNKISVKEKLSLELSCSHCCFMSGINKLNKIVVIKKILFHSKKEYLL